MFIETSAKEGFNIKLLFRRLATALPSMEGNGAATAAAEAVPTVNLSAPPPVPASGGGGGGATSGGCAC